MSPERTEKSIPAVSIVIPTYNHAEYLQQALQSVIDQTFHDWEAIIVNNFSDDATLQIIEQFDEPRFRVINFRNQGVIAASRNEGLRNSLAPVIAFLDSDDTWYKNKLSKCMSEFENGANVVCHGENWISDSSVPRAIFYGPAEKATHRNLLFRGNCISTSATLVNKEILEQLSGFSENPSFITAEDYELWMRLSLATTNFVFIHEILGEFRRHGESASRSVLRHLNAELAVVDRHILLAQQKDFFSFRARNRKAKAIYSAGRTCMQAKEYRLASSFFLRAIMKSPFFIRSFVALALTIARWIIRK